MRRALILCLTFLILLCSNSITSSAEVQGVGSRQEKLVRVGWFPKTFYMEKKDGEYVGFCREYIDKIADYANFRYEFVEGTSEELYRKLLSGEIDMIPLLYKNQQREKEILFATDSTYEAIYIFTQSGHAKSEAEFEMFNGSKVGYICRESVYRMEDYIKERGLQFDYIPYENIAEMTQAMNKGEVDLILTNKLFVNTNQVLVDKIMNGEMALAVSKHKKDILKEVDKALIKIEVENPRFTELLKQEYTKGDRIKFYLSPKEEEIIKNNRQLTVAIDNLGVYQHYNSATGKFEGIQIKLMDKVAEIIGVEFQYILVDPDSLFDSQTDIIGSVEEHDQYAHELGYRMTTPYLTTNYVQLRKKKGVIGDVEKAGVFYKRDRSLESYQVYYNLEQMFKDFIGGDLEELYISSLNADYLIRKYGFEGVIRIPLNGATFRSCMAIREDLPIDLLTVINRAILSISQNDVQDLITSEDIYYERNFLGLLKEHPIAIVSISLIVITAFSTLFVTIIYREKRHKRELLILSQKDPMTKLWNKIVAENEITDALNNNKDNEQYALAIFDIDHFKTINDTYGHLAGDKVIVHFANLLTRYFEEYGIIGRIGGDEFILFMKIADEKMVRDRMERFLNSNEFDMYISNRNIKISTSIGIALYPQCGQNRKEIYKAADRALYDVKDTGRSDYKMAGN